MLLLEEDPVAIFPKEYTEQILPILWIDNDLSIRPTVTVSASFTIDGVSHEYNEENAEQYLGIPASEFKEIAKKDNTGTYDVYAVNAPVKVMQGETEKTVAWTLTPSLSADKAGNYMAPTIENKDGYNGVYIYREKSSLSFIVDIKNGASSEEFSVFADEIDLYKQVGNAPAELIGNITSESDSQPIITANTAGTYTVTFDSLPRFTDEKVELIYSLKAAESVAGDAEDGDYYKTSYNNAAGSNFSNNQTECHDQGTLELILTGTTEYRGTKVWLDDGTEIRPKATWSLWRYSDKEGITYKEAAQVADEAGNNLTLMLDSTKTIQEYIRGDLEKYDPEGYPYKYLARELMDGGSYEQVHLTGYTKDENGQVTGITEENRSDGGDKSVYHDGILANRITGQTNVSWQKVWKAGNYQNDLSNVEVTLQLQRRPESVGGEWGNIEGATQVINNFIAENLIQSGSVSVSKYDELGLPQEYQWVESSITENGTQIAIGEDGRFQLSHNTDSKNLSPNGCDDEYYISEVETREIENPENPDSKISRTVVTNRLAGTTTYRVDKLWAQLDKDGNVTGYGKTAPQTDAEVKVQLYQNGNPYTAEDIDAASGYTLNTGNNFCQEYKIPKYDASGIKYTYDAKEISCTPDWHVDINYNVTVDNIHYDMQMKNTPAGKGKSIWIRKDWMDDGDEVHRQNVTVELYRKAQKNDADEITDPEKYFGQYTLTASNNWKLEVGVTEYTDDSKTDVKQFPLDQYYIREVGIGTGSTCAYDIYNSGAGFDSETGGAPILNTTIDKVDTTLNGENLTYEVYYNIDDDELVVVNRRVGIVNLAVTKKWIDGGNENNTRPADVILALKAAADDGYSAGSVTIDNEASTVTVNGTVGGGGVYNVPKKEGQSSGTVQKLSTEDGEVYEFYHLPKYDALGRVLHYTVEERGLKAPYSGSLTMGEYDATFIEDNQPMTLINRRAGIKIPEFHKIWKDRYNYETGRRPDIYFTLYSAKRNDDGNYVIGKVAPYPSRTWEYTSAMEGKCIFDSGLPKYDDKGYEIFYYATEGSQVNMGAFDYLAEEFYSDANAAQKSSKYAGADGIVYDSEENGGFQVLPESGCFVNRIQAEITVKGQKVWKNIPSGFPGGDFPALRMNLYRTVTPTVTGTDILTFKEALDNITGLNTDGVYTEKDSPIAYTEILARISGTNKFTFFMDVEGDNDQKSENPVKLQKYDADGRLYDYTIEEELVNTDNENLGNTTYEELPGEVNNFIVTNTYEIKDEKNTGHLRVTKNWAGIADLTTYSYPGIQFKLYRQYISNDSEQNTETISYNNGTEKVTKPELVDTQTLNAGKVITGTVDFDASKLRIYAPNLTKYYYTVEETLLSGYNYVETEMNTKPQKSDVFQLNQDETMEAPHHVTFENEYQPDREDIILTGKKIWDDNGDAFGIRPEFGEYTALNGSISLWRYTDAQNLAGGAGAIAEEKVTLQNINTAESNYIQWTDDDSGTWTYTIKNLDKYAPNTMPWKYVVKEKAVSGYQASPADTDTTNINGGRVDSKNGTLMDNADTDATDSITMPDMTNSSKKSASVKKTWANDDRYGIRPARVVVELYAKIGNNDSWEPASTVLKGVLKAEQEALPADVTVGLKELSKDTNWSADYSKLPAYVKQGDAVQPIYYQAVEINIGGTVQDGAVNGGYDLKDAGLIVDDMGGSVTSDQIPYKVSSTATYTSDADFEQQFGKKDQTAVKNEVHGDGNVNLKITKTWEDSQDAYDTRSVTDADRKTWKADFALYRKAGGGGAWEQVQSTGNQPIILRVTAANNHDAAADAAAMAYGPFPKYDSSLELYTYAAVEITPYGYVKTETLPEGLSEAEPNVQNARIIAGMQSAEGATFDFSVKTVNKLDPTTFVEAAKSWKKADGTEFISAANTKVTFELLKNGKSFETPVTKEITFDGQQSENTVTFTDLPRYTYGSGGEITPIIYSIQEVTVNGGGTTTPTVPNGFWKTIGEMTAEGAVSEEAYSLSGTIINTQTEFELDKLDTVGIPITDQTTKLGIYKGGTKVAAWTREKTTNGYKETVAPETGSTVEAVSAVNGSAHIKGLPIGTYTLKEESVPWGYEKAADITFTLSMSEGKLVLTSTTLEAAGGDVDDNTLKLVMKDEPIQLTLKKVATDGTTSIDSTDNYAEFTVTGIFADGSTEKNGITSENINSLDKLWIATTGTTEGTDQFTYTFTETKAPAGYELAPFFKITIKADGTIKAITADSGNNPASGINTAELTVADEPIKIQVKKTDKNGSNLTGAEFRLDDYGTEGGTTGTPVQSVTFVCTNELFSTITDKTDGNKKITMTQNHSYVLTETKAPLGYLLPQDTSGTANLSQKFVVGTDGKITSVGTTDSRITVDENNPAITVKDEKIQLTLAKEDIESPAAKLSGAEFALYKGENATGTPVMNSIVTSDGAGVGTPGTVIFPAKDSEVLLEATYDTDAPVYYTLKEIQAPFGYELIAEPLTFYITSAGKMVFIESPEYSGNGTDGLTVKNTKTEFTLEKQGKDADAEPVQMKDVSLKIYERNADGSRGIEVLTWTRDSNGAATITRSADTPKYNALDTALTNGHIKGLPAGNYVLAEDAAPDAYLKIGDTPFTVKTDGTIAGNSIISTNGSSYVTFGSDKLSITATDMKIRGDVKFVKYVGTGTDRKMLAGVKFDLYRDGGTDTPDVKIAEDLVTDVNGILTVKGQADTEVFLEAAGDDSGKKVNTGLPIGTYYLQEDGATADSVLDTSKKVNFTVERDETKKSEQPQAILGDVENEVFSAAVTFRKVDGTDGRPVDEATFKLKYTPETPGGNTAAYDGDSAHTYESDSNGMITMSGLQKGAYELYEVSAEGYQMTENAADGKFVCTFNIVEANHGETLKLDRTDGFSVTSGKGAASTDTAEYQVQNTRIKGSVAIKKQSGDENPLALNGARFSLTKIKEADGTAITDSKPHTFAFESGKNYKVDGNGFAEDTTAASVEGILKISGLDWGTYTLTETKAPNGYKLEDKTVTFEIKRNDRDLTAESDGHKVTNVRTAITLKKKDAASDTSFLPGAEFTIEPLEDKDAFAGDWKDSRSQNIVVDADGTLGGACVLEGKLIGGNSYRLTETKAPLGYELPTGNAAVTAFKVKEDGTIDGTANATDIIVSDEQITLNLTKQDMGGAGVTGAILDGTTFTIHGLFKKADGIDKEENTIEIVAAGGKLELTSLNGKWLASTGDIEGTDKFTYTLTETVAPKGYELPEDPDHTFIVDASGNITMTDEGAFSGNDENIIVKDAKIEADIQKTDENGNVIGDEKRGYAEFSVTGIFAGETEEITISGSAEKTNNISDLQTKLSGKLIAGNSYTLTETKAPDGYILPNPILTATFTMGVDGKIQLTDNAKGKVTVNNGTNGIAIISVKDSPIALSLTKSDIADTTNAVITGRGDAEFTVTPAVDTDTFADGGKTAVTVTTAENGMDALTGKLRPNVSYTMTETVAPKGYQLAAPFTFKVDAQGKVTLEGTTGQASAENSHLTVKDQKIEVSLRKVSSQDEKADAMDSEKLAGAVFEITPEAGSAFAVEVTDKKITLSDANENGLSGMLIAGHTYKVHEVAAPAGYELAQDFTFTMDENGRATVINPGTADVAKAISGDTDSVVIRVKDEPIELSIIKKDKTDPSKTLTGAEFKLIPVSENTFADGSTAEKTLITGADGKAVIPSASLKQNAKYVLTETKAPNGYVLANPAPGVELHVQTDGTVTFTEVKNQWDYSIEGTGTTVIAVTDRMTKLTLDKTDNETKARLAGATMEIYQASDFDLANGTPNNGAAAKATWTSTTAAAGEITGLQAGTTYVLYEAVTPSGYDSFNPVSFTLETDNQITLADADRADVILAQDNAGAEAAGNWTITMTDTRIRGHVALTKTVKDGKTGTVAGVEFALYYQTGSAPDVNADKKIAENLTTDANGVWKSQDNKSDKFKDPSDKDAEVLFSKGLPTGNYYFVETKATADTALDSTAKHTFSIGNSDTEAHGKVVAVSVENTAFSAKVTLQKLDEKSETGIEGVEFKLTYIPEYQSEVKEVTGVTNNTGVVTFEGLPKGTYTLTETKADGYDIAGVHDESHKAFTATFTIDEDDNGKEIRIDSNAGSDSANPKATKIQGEWNTNGITNPRLLGSVTIHKADGDDTSKALEGVEFKLMKQNDSGSFVDWLKNLFTGNKYAYADVPTDNLTGTALDKKGTLTIKNLDWGTYKLVETKAKDGYSTSSAAQGAVVATAEFTIDRTSAKVIELKTDGHDFYNYKTLLTIQKDGTDGVQGLAGAEFVLMGADAETAGRWVNDKGETVEEPMTVTTDANGQIILKGVLIGGETYTLHETKAPEGYELITTDLKFTMNADGSITAVSGEMKTGEGYIIGTTGAFSNQLTAVDTPVELKLVKKDADATNVLTGAVFKVTPKTGSRFADGSDSITLKDTNMTNGLNAKLIAGHTYILEEVTAPAGYEKNAPIEFTVDSYGEVTITSEGAPAEMSEEGTVEVLMVKDTPIQIQLKKQDAADETIGLEAVFTLEHQKTDKTWEVLKENIKTTGGQISLSDEVIFIGGDTYRLTEMTAPKGYEVLTAPLVFTVNVKGSLEFTQTAEYTGNNSDVLTVKNTKTAFFIEKKDSETGEDIAEDDLALTIKESGGTVVAVWNHNAEGVYELQQQSNDTAYSKLSIDSSGLISGLPAGDYVLAETETPYGYLTVPEYAFTMNPDGTIQPTNGGTSDGSAVISSNKLTLTMTDTVIRGHVTLTKMLAEVTADSNKLEGVKFNLYRQDGDTKNPETDTLIAECTTDENGEWTTSDNETANGGEEGKLIKDGLRSGTYYFVETLATADSVLDAEPVEVVIDGGGTDQPEKTVSIENEPFTSEICLTKLDAKNGEALEGDAVFELTKVNNEADGGEYPDGLTAFEKRTETIDDKGMITFGELTKGTYHVKEISASGYDIDKIHGEDHVPFEADIIIGEAHDGQTIVLDRETLENEEIAQNVRGSYNEDGISNPRLLGSITIHKADGEDVSKALYGVEFKLMKQQEKDGETGFTDWLKNLFTGNKYVYEDAAAENLTGEILDDKGALTVENLDWGAYKLVETRAKDGYSTTDAAEGEVVATTEFTIDRYSSKVVELSSDGNNLKNYKTLLTIQKDGTDGVKGLAGAEFVLMGADAETAGRWVNDNGETVEEPMTVTTDANGQIILKGVLIGGETYTLHETKAPEGYELITTDLKFTMNADGSITAVSGEMKNGEGYILTESKFFANTVTAVDKPVEMKLVKKDAEGRKILTGAEFNVTPKDGSRFADDSESISLTDENMADGLNAKLIAGNTYILEEVTAPKGYEKGKDIEFTIDVDGKVSVASEEADAEVAADGDIEVLTVKNKPIEVSFLKRLVGDRVDTGISGAEFMLTPEEGKAFADGSEKITFTSGKEAEAITGKLIGGDTYTLIETKAPEGSMDMVEGAPELYSFTFKVDVYGAVHSLKGDAEADGIILTYDEASDRITFWNEPTVLTIFKRDMSALGSGHDPILAGCTFAITGRFAAGRYQWMSSAPGMGGRETIQVTTDGADTAENALKGRLIVGETYRIEEISAPAGFELGVDVTFTVTGVRQNVSGKPTLIIELSGETGEKGNKGYWVSYDGEGNPVITQRDEPVEVKLQKTDMDGQPLTGAQFRMTGTFADGSGEETRTFEADSQGQVDLSKLLIESKRDADYIYRIHETKAPEGYTGLESDIVFKLISEKQSDGKRRSVVQILYGEGLTPNNYSDYLKAAAASDDIDMQILSVANPKTPEEAPVNQGSGVKTGDMSNIGFYMMMLMVSGAILLSGVKKRRK